MKEVAHLTKDLIEFGPFLFLSCQSSFFDDMFEFLQGGQHVSQLLLFY